MGLMCSEGRNHCGRRRLDVESLENRELLTHVPHLANLVHRLGAANVATETASPPAPSGGATNFDQITGASTARAAYGVDGTGMAVAVIDTGVNYNNADFGGGGFGPGHKVVAGFDFSTNTSDPFAVTWQHGTAVAGLAAGDSSSSPGIAPGANIVALRVFGNDNTGSFSRIASALQWVVDNHAKYNITVVNLSLSDGGNYTQNDFTSGVGGQIVSLIRTLDNLNIPVVAATGNSFTGVQGEGFSAIVPDTISVTATTADDHLVANAQRLGKAEGGEAATVIAAPGQGLYVPSDGNSFTTEGGTSFAAPLVSGSAILLQQIYQSRFGHLPTVTQLEGWLRTGAVTVHDSVTGIDIGRLNIPGAAGLIPSPEPATPPLVPTPPPMQVIAPSRVVAPPPQPVVETAPPPVVVTPPPVVAPPSRGDLGGIAILSFNGKPVKSFDAKQSPSDWSPFLSLFTGRLTSVSGWGKANDPVPVVASTSTPKAVAVGAPKPMSTLTTAVPRAWKAGFVSRGRAR